MRMQRSIEEPLRINPDWEARWGMPGAGLVTSWERGRELAIENLKLATAATRGELVQLSWKGGIATGAQRPPRQKYGSLNYLAMWQGLRGEDLDIETDP